MAAVSAACDTPCEDTLTCDVGGNQGGASSTTGTGDGGGGTGGVGGGSLGQACTDGGTCASGNCVDGVCCDAACSGQCETCGEDGLCVAIAAGDADPDIALCSGVCDGVRGCSTLAHRFSRDFRTTGGPSVLPSGVAVDQEGSPFVSGAVSGGALQLGGQPLGTAFIAKFSSSGSLGWVEAWEGGAGPVALDAAGNAYVAGSVADGDQLPGCTTAGGALVKYASLGTVEYCRNVAVQADPLAALADGRVAVVTNQTSTEVTVRAFDINGLVSGQTTLSSTLELEVTSITALPTSFVVGGVFRGTADMAGSQLNGTGQSGFVVSLNADLSVNWAKSFGSDVEHVQLSGRSNRVGVGASFEGGADLGSGEILSSGRDLLVARLDGDGTAEWAVRVNAGEQGAASAVEPTAVAIDGAGNVAVAGKFIASLELGGLTGGTQDPALFLGKLSAVDGTVLTGRSWPQGEHNVGSLDSASDGAVWFLGDGNGFIDFGGGDIEVLTDTCFLAGFEP